MLVSHAERFITSGNLELGLAITIWSLLLGKNKISRPKLRLIEYRSMKNFDNAEFLTELKNASWGTA